MRATIKKLLAIVPALLLAAWRWQSFRCPRCERGFFNRRPLFLPLLANRCVHCLLPRT